MGAGERGTHRTRPTSDKDGRIYSPYRSRSQVNLKFGVFASYTVVVQERQIYFTKRRDTLAELLFCSLNLLFCFVFTLPRPSPS